MDYLSLNTTSAWFPDLDSPFFLICQIVRTSHPGFLFAYSTTMLFHGFHYFYVSSVIRPGITQYSHPLVPDSCIRCLLCLGSSFLEL